ncbi:protein kinase-PH domain-containing protein [Reticulomyxa filosa]|uniref:non-specific serine/threonine protein kinase n=1 Tax=Reticulomyxa filosa TaxID=46433 RepID=X6NVR6_RETFI|nr:protein kinase-PH domain-containing protein [Reticulomyxa filosa]|eukprot:ETO29983.1 protein kinase-PH domain-containing protein [Reticulomyxa filosa]
MFRLAERTRKIVNELVDEAFLHLDQENTDKLSRAQFCEWVTRNPDAMEVLNTVFAKHVLDDTATVDEKDADTNESATEYAHNENSAHHAAHSLSVGSNAHIVVSPDMATAKKATSSQSYIPTALLPLHERLLEQHEHEADEEYYTVYTCNGCGFKYSTSTLANGCQSGSGSAHMESENNHPHISADAPEHHNSDHQSQDHNTAEHKNAEAASIASAINVTAASTVSDVLILQKDGPNRDIAIKYCMQCGQELEKQTLKSETYEPWKNSLITRSCYKQSVRKCGPLFKIGRKSGMLVERFYVLEDKNLYTFKLCLFVFFESFERRQEDRVACDAFFIHGWFIAPFDDHYAHAKDKSKQYFGIELHPPQNNSDNAALRKYARTKEERDEWVKAFCRAASTGSLDDYYTIGEVLGRGHFSVVHLGVHKKTNKKYAIKVVEKKKVDASQRMCLQNEIAIMKLVKHPYIINMLDVFEDRKMIYMIMALVEHGDLFKRWFSRPGKPKVFPEQVTKIIIYKLLDALQYLHGLGIVHRDLKPENVSTKYNLFIYKCFFLIKLILKKNA